MTALQELLSKVEVGTVTQGNKKAIWPDFDFEGKGYGYRVNANMAVAYNGSLDAAKALHEAVLPDHCVRLSLHQSMTWWHCYVRLDGCPAQSKYEQHGMDKNPARAWLIAIIKALIAKEQST